MAKCGNPKCSASKTIEEEISFGRGQLDIYGCWQFPCDKCARDYEEQHPGETAWPHARASWKNKGGVKPQKQEV